MQAYIFWTTAKSLDEDSRQMLLERLPAQKRQQLLPIKDEQRQASALWAEALLQYAMQKVYGQIPPAKTRKIGPKGKPYYEAVPYYFSLSHSQHYALAAVAEVPIGADIQVARPADYAAIAKRMYTPEEQQYLEAAQDKQDLFYRMWVCKESLGKCLGTGIYSGLPAVWQGLRPKEEYCCIREGDMYIGGCGEIPLQWQIYYIEPMEGLQFLRKIQL